jgi:hypothetical protein
MEVRVELKRLIHNKRATRHGTRMGSAASTDALIDESDSDRRGATLVRTDNVTEGVTGRSRFLLKSIITRRHDGREDSEDTQSAKDARPSHTQRYDEARERPASKSYQAYQERTDIYTGPHAPTSKQN